MRRTVITVLLVLVALAGFYGAWPAYTGHVIRTAIKGGDAATLAGKVDYAEVRAALRPVVASELQRALEDKRETGNTLTRALAGTFSGRRTQRLVQATVDRIATPENTIRLARYSGTLRQYFRRALSDEMTRGLSVDSAAGNDPASEKQMRRTVLDRILGRRKPREAPAAAQAAADPAEKAAATPAPDPAPRPERKYTIANIKRLALTGPLTLEVGVNRDPAQPWPELTAVLRFTGLDWKVVALIPSLDR